MFTSSGRAAIQEFRKEQKPEDITDSEWWFDKWFNFDSKEKPKLEPKNNSTNYKKPKFRPYPDSPWWFDSFNKKKPINSRKGGTRKVRKVRKVRKTSRKKRVKKEENWV